MKKQSLVGQIFENISFAIQGSPEPESFVSPRVLVLNFDPIYRSQKGQRLHEVCDWNDPRVLTDGYIKDLEECSDGYVRYQIVEWQDVDVHPVKKDGFRYTNESYLRCREGKEEWHQPDAVDYHAILGDFSIASRVEAGEIDEVWV